jgi:hypothetical protein
MSTTTPPGWYPDPSGQPGNRWWDGAAWTQHVNPPAGPVQRPRIPDGVATDTLPIWLLALQPVLVVLLQFAYRPELRFRTIGPGGLQALDPASVYTVGYFVLQVGGLLLYGAAVLLAFLDHRALRRRGVVRPFPWPWAFLATIVYVIGRFVVVRKVAPGRPMWPLWTYLVVGAVGTVFGVVRAAALFQQMLP